MTVLTSLYWAKPYSPSSLPIPDILKPPNGAIIYNKINIKYQLKLTRKIGNRKIGNRKIEKKYKSKKIKKE
jgi:hypothetical protein